MRKPFRMIVPLLMLVAAPLGVSAQQGGGIVPAQLSPEAQELITEMQQIQAQIQVVQQQALEDPEIQSTQEEIGVKIEEAMTEMDPATPERIAKLETLMAEVQEAQAARDQAKVGEIVAEAREIQAMLQAAQQQALGRPDLAARVEAFQDALQKKMIEVSPEVEGAMNRLEELNGRLAMLLGQAN